MVRILSDLHLGHSASRVKKVGDLAPLMEGCEQVVFAGDVWQERRVVRDEAERMLGELRALAGERGVFLRGNHDPKSGEGIAWLGEGKVLVTHGDAVYRDATPWSREMPYYREEVEEIIARYDENDAQECADRAQEIALLIEPHPLPKLPVPFNFFATAMWPPSRTLEMLRVWATMGAEGLRFLERVAPEAGVLVCGHFHRVGIWEKDGRVVMNTGSFMRGSRTWCVDVEEEWVTAREVTFDGEWRAGEVRGRWRLG
ncbi:MAG: metallophosphoesterase [Verrucomicrobiaceae bacterium]